MAATTRALHAFEKTAQAPDICRDRCVNGDGGDVPEQEKQEHEGAVEQGFRMLSAYTTSAGDRMEGLTEADRSATIIF